MNKYKFLDKRDSAKANSPKPSGVSFNDNRAGSLQLRNLQRQINSSVVVQKQADLQSGVNEVLQCYTKGLVNITEKKGSKEYVAYKYALISEDANKEAIILTDNKEELWINGARKPQPESHFKESGNEKSIYNKQYKGYVSKLQVGVDGVENDCGRYATALINNDLSVFEAEIRLLTPKTMVKGKNLLFDLFNTRKEDYTKSKLPVSDPEVGEAYSIFPNKNLEKKLNVNHHIAPVVFKTATDCITSELDAGNKNLKTPYFEMYKGANAKKGSTFDEKFLVNQNLGNTKQKYWIPILTSIKRYYEEEDNKKKPVKKLAYDPGKLTIKITSNNDSDKYVVRLYDINNNCPVPISKNGTKKEEIIEFKNKNCTVTTDYIDENNKRRDNLLIYIGKGKLSLGKKEGPKYKYMGRLNIPDMIENKSEINMKHLEDEKAGWSCCNRKIMSFKVECSGEKFNNVGQIAIVGPAAENKSEENRGNVLRASSPNAEKPKMEESIDDSGTDCFVYERTEEVQKGTNRVKIEEVSVKLPEN